MKAYMKGHVAALIVQYDNFGDRGNIVRVWTQLPIHFARTFLKTLIEGSPGRLGILAAEIKGWLAGLQFFLRFGWRKQQVPVSAANAIAKETAR
jgi:hypothetical protein